MNNLDFWLDLSALTDTCGFNFVIDYLKTMGLNISDSDIPNIKAKLEKAKKIKNEGTIL